MASRIPPVKNVAYEFYWGLVSQADTKLLQVNPTLAAGDVKVSVDGAAFANITTLPVVTPSGGTAIKVNLSADETNGDNIQIQWIDAAGAEWCSVLINLQTALRKIDDLAFPVSSGNGIDVTATGAVGIDWANIEGKTSVVDLSGTTIDVDQVIASVAADTATLPDSVAAQGIRPTPQQAWLMLTRFLMERAVIGLVMTVNKETGVPSMTFTLNDATNPTSITRTT